MKLLIACSLILLLFYSCAHVTPLAPKIKEGKEGVEEIPFKKKRKGEN